MATSGSTTTSATFMVAAVRAMMKAADGGGRVEREHCEGRRIEKDNWYEKIIIVALDDGKKI
jgi:hypothetical protein